MNDLKNKVALVTGAAGRCGIGRAISLRLAKEGAKLIINDIVETRLGDADWAGLSGVAEEIETAGGEAFCIIADVSDASQVDDMVRRGVERFGYIDILVNNAGAPAGEDRKPVVDLDEEAWDLIQNVNVKGTFLCSRAVARSMIERGAGGRIINISSTAGKRGVARYAAYCASKFGLRGFGESLASELRGTGVHVTNVYPCFSQTAILDSPQYGYEQRRGVPAYLVSDPADVVARVVAGVSRNKRHVFPDRHARVIHYVTRFVPWLVPLLDRRLHAQSIAAGEQPRR